MTNPVLAMSHIRSKTSRKEQLEQIACEVAKEGKIVWGHHPCSFLERIVLLANPMEHWVRRLEARKAFMG